MAAAVAVEAAVHTRFDVLRARLLTAVAQPPDAGRDRFISCNDCAAIAECAQILCRIETECRRFGPCTDADAALDGEMCLTAVLDEGQRVAGSDETN